MNEKSDYLVCEGKEENFIDENEQNLLDYKERGELKHSENISMIKEGHFDFGYNILLTYENEEGLMENYLNGNNMYNYRNNK